MKDRERMVLLVTLCGTLVIATVAIPFLMLKGVNVAKEVSLSVAAQWGAGLLILREWGKP